MNELEKTINALIAEGRIIERLVLRPDFAEKIGLYLSPSISTSIKVFGILYPATAQYMGADLIVHTNYGTHTYVF